MLQRCVHSILCIFYVLNLCCRDSFSYIAGNRSDCFNVVCLFVWCLRFTPHQRHRLYGDGTLILSLIRRTDGTEARISVSWITRQVTYPLHHNRSWFSEVDEWRKFNMCVCTAKITKGLYLSSLELIEFFIPQGLAYKIGTFVLFKLYKRWWK